MIATGRSPGTTATLRPPMSDHEAVVRHDHVIAFPDTIRELNFGTARLFVLPPRWWRADPTPAFAKEPDPNQYLLVVTLRADVASTSSGRQIELSAEDVKLYGNVLQFLVPTLHDQPERHAHLVVQIPRALLPSRSVDLPVAVRVLGTAGPGALVSEVLIHLAMCTEPVRMPEAAYLRAVLINLATMLLARQATSDTVPNREIESRRRLADILDFIRSRLGDPSLSPGAIAAAHHISIRHLHRLFEQHGLRVVGWMRERRLERCRLDLADPGQHNLPIHAVAMRWGFVDSAHFSRVFRAACGVSPSEYRRLAHVEASGLAPIVKSVAPGDKTTRVTSGTLKLCGPTRLE